MPLKELLCRLLTKTRTRDCRKMTVLHKKHFRDGSIFSSEIESHSSSLLGNTVISIGEADSDFFMSTYFSVYHNPAHIASNFLYKRIT